VQLDNMRELLSKQKKFFNRGDTLSVKFRANALKRFLNIIEKYEERVIDALREDLGKSRYESYMCEVALVKSELGYMLRHIKRFSSIKRVHTPLAQFASKSYVKPVPYGSVLIMSPWNYPFLLTCDPLIDAIAAGNTAIVKPSAYSPATSAVIAQMLYECFPAEYVAAVTGGRQENTSLLQCDFDYIFFTGSKTVGREVMRAASERLIPVTLELGGKSPCIVDKTADISLAAKRIVFGKFINCGQTCVAPDYIYCHSSVKNRLLSQLKKQISIQYGDRPLENENYGRIVNGKHFERLCALMEQGNIVSGGETCAKTLQISPTIMDSVGWNDPVMREEIFGPILPVLVYDNLFDVIEKINSSDSPLALYLFTSDRKTVREVTSRISYGGGCINDTLIHLATSGMGFGGVGESGMGAYHGKRGFDTFTHFKSIVDKKTFVDLPMRYQPYSDFHDRLIRLFVK